MLGINVIEGHFGSDKAVIGLLAARFNGLLFKALLTEPWIP